MSSYNISTTTVNDGRVQQTNPLLLSINPNIKLLNQTKLNTNTAMMSTLQIPTYQTDSGGTTSVTTFQTQQSTLAPPQQNSNQCQPITPTPPPPITPTNPIQYQQIQNYMLQHNQPSHNNTSSFNIASGILGNNNALTIQLNKNININGNVNANQPPNFSTNNKRVRYKQNNNNNHKSTNYVLSNTQQQQQQYPFNNVYDNASITPSLLHTNVMTNMQQLASHQATNNVNTQNKGCNNLNGNHRRNNSPNYMHKKKKNTHYYSQQQRVYRKKSKQASMSHGMSVVDENDTDPNLVQCTYCSDHITSSALPHHSDACGYYPKPCGICGKNIKQQNHVKHRKEMHPDAPPIDDPNLLKLQSNHESAAHSDHDGDECIDTNTMDTDTNSNNGQSKGNHRNNNNRRNTYNNNRNHHHRYRNNNNHKARNRMNNNRKAYNNRNKRYNNRMNNNENQNQYNRNRKQNRHAPSYTNQTQEEVKQQQQPSQTQTTANSNQSQPQSADTNVWCPYYQYGCKTYFPKSQIQNHLRAHYREHLIIQIAQMYKLVNLVITSIGSFPTFDKLMQQPPIDTSNAAVRNSLQYLSQYNAHLVSLMSQQQQQQPSDGATTHSNLSHQAHASTVHAQQNNARQLHEDSLPSQEVLNAHVSSSSSVVMNDNKSQRNLHNMNGMVRRNNSRHSIHSSASNHEDALSNIDSNNNKTDEMSSRSNINPNTNSNANVVDNVMNDTSEMSSKCGVVTNEMEKFASNLRLPRPQLHTASLINDVRTNTPDPPCPMDMYPSIINVCGRSGFNSEINGDYYLFPKLHRNRPCYKKLNSTWCIRWNSTKTEWMIDCDGLKDDDIACARVKQDCPHPALVTNPWRVYNNPRNQEDNNVIIRVVADSRSTAIHYCKSNGVEWPPFASAMNDRNDTRYDPIRQTTHSRVSSNEDMMVMEEEEEEETKQQHAQHKYQMDLNHTTASMTAMSGYDMNMNDEELQQQRQRHQDQYLESMPTPQNGYSHNNRQRGMSANRLNAGTVLSTVSIAHRPVRTQVTQQAMVVDDSKQLIPVHEEEAAAVMSDNVSDNMSTRATTLEVYDPNVLDDVAASKTSSIRSKPPLKHNNNNYQRYTKSTFANIVSAPPIKKNDHQNGMYMNDNTASKSARRKKRRKNKKACTK